MTLLNHSANPYAMDKNGITPLYLAANEGRTVCARLLLEAGADAMNALYLKRLSDAIKDHDPIRSIVRNTSVNANGRTAGITLPSSVGQESVIAHAYKGTEIQPQTIGYVECHGTGTPVGDPIEIEAVANFYTKPFRTHVQRQPLLIGSVKSSLGHSEAASGITSIIKTTLALEHLQIPATIGAENLNPKIPWDEYNVKVVRSLTSWPTEPGSQPPRAGINSFGYGGANSHCILERASSHCLPHGLDVKAPLSARRFIYPISAKTAKSLEARVEDLAAMDLTKLACQDLAYTLAERREPFSWRGFLVTGPDTVATDINIEAFRPTVRLASLNRLPFAFIFTGQGAQWPQMGKELIERYPHFRGSLKRLQGYLSLLTDSQWSLSEAIRASPVDSEIDKPEVSQIACTAIQIALVDLLRSWEILPSLVVGHSSGEIAAAYTAGHITSFHAMAIAYVRGQVVSSGPTKGAMMAVGMTKEEAEQLLIAYGVIDEVSVACINSPTSVTLSGNVGAIEVLLESLQQAGKFARKLHTGGIAYHSHHMKHIGEKYESQLCFALSLGSEPSQTYVSADFGSVRERTPMISSVFGSWVLSEATTKPSYWRTNLESPVNFNSAISAISANQGYQFIEIGPHPVLETPVKHIRSSAIDQANTAYLPTLRRGQDSEKSLLSLTGNLWTSGYPIKFSKINNSGVDDSSRRNCRVLTDLPTYRWDHSEKLWKEPRMSYELRHPRYPRDELLGSSIPGSSGLTFTWRNLLNTTELPWLQDHKLADDVVFPAAGYVAVASRAAQQLGPKDISKHILEIRNTSVIAALVLPSNSSIEMFTELVPKRFSDINESPLLWHFTIVSFNAGKSRKHAAGEVGFVPQERTAESVRPLTVDESECQHHRIWYSQFSKLGLNYGPAFRSLSEIHLARMRDKPAGKASLVDLANDIEDKRQDVYPFELHPTAIDSTLQVGMIARSKGNPEKLVARIPVFIELARIWPGFRKLPLSQLTVKASCQTVAFGIDMFQAEILSRSDESIFSCHNVKTAPFHGMLEEKSERHAVLRVQWEPDLSRISPSNSSAFTSYIEQRMKESQVKPASAPLYPCSAVVVEILSHCQVELSILCVGPFRKPIIAEILSKLGFGTPFKRFSTFKWGHLDEQGDLEASEISTVDLTEDRPQLRLQKFSADSAHRFDVILSLDPLDIDQSGTFTASLSAYLKSNGKMIVTGDASYKNLANLGFQVLRFSPENSPTIALGLQDGVLTKNHMPNGVTKPNTMLVVNDKIHPLNLMLSKRLGVPAIHLQDLAQREALEKSTVLVTAELENCMLSNVEELHFTAIQKITNNASKIVWVTGGNLTNSQKPESSLILGLARTLTVEQPSLEFFVVDIDNPREDLEISVANLLAILESKSTENIDYEYLQKDGVLFASRFIADIENNNSFNQKKVAQTKPTILREAGHMKLSIKEPGQMDTLQFISVPSHPTIPDEYVEIQVMAVGVNAKDLYTLSGKIETAENTCSCEFSGLVTRVGSKVSGLSVGDRVLACAPGYFATYERVPARACCRLQDNERFCQMASVPVVFMTATHAIRNLAWLQRGESVLVHSAAGGVGIAAIQLAKDIGAEVFVTVGTQAKRAYLSERFGLPDDHIFSSRDTLFVHEVLKITRGRGVDVVLNSLTGDKLHGSLEVCAKFGRFIEIGKRDILDAGNLNMRIFKQGITFSAFDLHELYYSPLGAHQKTYTKLLQDAVALYRKLGAPEPQVFNASDISGAFRLFSTATRVGKVVVSFEDSEQEIPHVPPKFVARFSQEKSYLLIGCLGGLGRSITRYMLAQGARHFSFIGRSGLEKAAAKSLVQDLEACGATVDVVRGDVQDFVTVESAINRLRFPLGGVVQAAMTLAESLFTAMTALQWRDVLGPKVRGTWNIHRAIAGNDAQLDFFLMTSSVAGSIGSATEANYCAANCFLDYFASYRRSLGLPGTSLALGQISGVGYVHEHEDIEQMLSRRGMADLSEDDMLCFIDIALSSPRPDISGNQMITTQPRQSSRVMAQTQAHLLTGLETARLSAIWDRGYRGSYEILKADPRLRILFLGTPRFHETQGSSVIDSLSGNTLPQAIRTALSAAKDDNTDNGEQSSLSGAIFEVLADRLSQLILMPRDKISPELRLSEVGMDSMLAAEFRTYVFRVVGVDVPFLNLMDERSRMADIVEGVKKGLVQA